MTRPEDPIYAIDELPPWPGLISLGAQHPALMSVYLVLIVIVFRSADAGHAAILNALSLGMIALAISTLLQAIWRGPVGSGYLALITGHDRHPRHDHRSRDQARHGGGRGSRL